MCLCFDVAFFKGVPYKETCVFLNCFGLFLGTVLLYYSQSYRCICQKSYNWTAQHHSSPAKHHNSPTTFKSYFKTKLVCQKENFLWDCANSSGQNAQMFCQYDSGTWQCSLYPHFSLVLFVSLTLNVYCTEMLFLSS